MTFTPPDELNARFQNIERSTIDAHDRIDQLQTRQVLRDASAAGISDSLLTRVLQLEQTARLHHELLDTFVLSPWWKRILYVLDGWPHNRLTTTRRWRPWHRAHGLSEAEGHGLSEAEG